jgi:hypothetical protein
MTNFLPLFETLSVRRSRNERQKMAKDTASYVIPRVTWHKSATPEDLTALLKMLGFPNFLSNYQVLEQHRSSPVNSRGVVKSKRTLLISCLESKPFLISAIAKAEVKVRAVMSFASLLVGIFFSRKLYYTSIFSLASVFTLMLEWCKNH